MLALMTLSSLAALLFVYVFMPALWLSIMSADESLDAHESGLALVASRTHSFSDSCTRFSYLLSGNPFRETGPPANMAKLILLRHKVNPHVHNPNHLILHIFRFKTATENDAMLHIRVKHRELTAFHPPVRKHLGCASENPLAESSIIEYCFVLVQYPLLGHFLFVPYLYPPLKLLLRRL
jgi:hypothetical protein